MLGALNAQTITFTADANSFLGGKAYDGTQLHVLDG